jgi:DNA-binding CsgD family transcriptional regulator
MRTTHEGLGINEVDWKAFVELTAVTLVQSELPENEKHELFSVLTSFKTAIAFPNEAQLPRLKVPGYPQGLSRRQMEVLRLVVLGKNNSEIAQGLFISLNTVTRHLSNIFAKTGAKNRGELAVYAVRHRLV